MSAQLFLIPNANSRYKNQLQASLVTTTELCLRNPASEKLCKDCQKRMMASSNNKDCQKEEEDDGQRSNFTSLHLVKKYECVVDMLNTNQDSEEQESRGSEYLTAHSSCILLPDETLGTESSSNPSRPIPSSSSMYCSARIQSMMESRSKFSSELEFEIESSKVHWSELDPTFHIQHSGEANRKYFQELKHRQEEDRKEMAVSASRKYSRFQNFFREMDELVVGKKIAEGGQAEIYEASGGYVVKVFHAGCPLRDLQKQWPLGMLNAFHRRYRSGSLFWMYGAILLQDERFLDRFAFVMSKQWGDLRKLIDLRMLQNNNQGTPFTVEQVKSLMFDIAQDMDHLHNEVPPILHRDLKAANVLVGGSQLPSLVGSLLDVTVADYECSVGLVGTGFWRAPEILQQLKDRVPCSTLQFTEKSDVYSFGMTCYELVTGCIPFEGHSLGDYDLVLNGNRPKLPLDMDPLLKGIITSCWHQDPTQRPSFHDIIEEAYEKFGTTFMERFSGVFWKETHESSKWS